MPGTNVAVDARSPETAYATSDNIISPFALTHPNREVLTVQMEKDAAARQRDDEGNAALSAISGAVHTKTVKIKRR